MTEKEKQIIDGVDVSECFKYTKGFEEFDCGENYSKFHYRFCSENPNCFYKQLKRKEQECEELIKEKAEIKKYLGISDKTIIQRLEELQEFKDKLKISEYNYKQALDEIDSIADSNLCDDDCDVCPDDCLCDWRVVKDIINKVRRNNG